MCNFRHCPPLPVTFHTQPGPVDRRPSDEEHERMLEWLGLEDPSDFDPAVFDLARVNARLHVPVGGALSV
jgi:hypothetical protein